MTSSDLQRRQAPIAPEDVAALAQRADDLVGLPGAFAWRHRDDPVEGAVQRRAHQLGHAGIQHGKAQAVGILLEVDHPRQQRARGADQRTPGLDDDRKAGVAHGGKNRRRVFGRRRHRRAVVGNSQAAAEVEVLDLDAVVAQLAGQHHGPLGGAAQRIERRDLRADVDVQPHRLEPRLSGVVAIELPHLLERHAELVRLEPG